MQYNKGAAAAQSLSESLSSVYTKQEFMTVQSDFLKPTAADELAPQIFSLQAIVFAGGQAQYGIIEDTSVEDMDSLWRVHVQNPMRLVALLASKLRMNKTSYVLFIGSIWGEVGAAGETVYSAVKGAQHAFVKAYAQEAAPSNIRVNAIAPGFIQTDMTAVLPEKIKTEMLETIPLKRAGNPEAR